VIRQLYSLILVENQMRRAGNLKLLLLQFHLIQKALKPFDSPFCISRNVSVLADSPVAHDKADQLLPLHPAAHGNHQPLLPAYLP